MSYPTRGTHIVGPLLEWFILSEHLQEITVFLTAKKKKTPVEFPSHAMWSLAGPRNTAPNINIIGDRRLLFRGKHVFVQHPLVHFGNCFTRFFCFPRRKSWIILGRNSHKWVPTDWFSTTHLWFYGKLMDKPILKNWKFPHILLLWEIDE
jgi:hypothetical protein